MKQGLYFVHGNGFPARCYQQMFKSLEHSFEPFYIDKIGHATEFPITDNWPFLVHELIQNLEMQTSEQVVILGHSLGGILSFLAAIQRPELFKAVIMLDSPLLSRFKSHLIYLAKMSGLIDKLTPASRSLQRRDVWRSREEARQYLKRRALFRYFSPACLEDYLEYGMIKTDAGYELIFKKETEYELFCTVPHVLPEFQNRLNVPTALIYGTQSHMLSRSDVRYMKKNYKVNTYKIQGGHMFPLQRPESTAGLIESVVSELMTQ